MDDVRTTGSALRTNGQFIIAVQTGRFTLSRRLELRVLQFVGDVRQRRGTFRQVHVVLRHLRIEIDIVALDRQVLEGVIAEGRYGERDLIDRGTTVSGSHCDTGLAVDAGSGHRDRLELIGSDRFYRRQFGCSHRQVIGVAQHLRLEVRQGLAVDEDTLQRGDLRFLGGEDQLVHRLIAVSGGHRHAGRSVDAACRINCHFLVVIARRVLDRRQRLRTHLQRHVIRHVIRRESQRTRVVRLGRVHLLYLIALHVQALEVRVRRGFQFDIQFIYFRHFVTGRRHGYLHRRSVDCLTFG